jgi:IS30 family transposase
MASLQGELAFVPLTEIAAILGRIKATVTLTIRRGQTETRFSIRDGAVVQANSTDPVSTLANI